MGFLHFGWDDIGDSWLGQFGGFGYPVSMDIQINQFSPVKIT
jgi:hypothetical protein